MTTALTIEDIQDAIDAILADAEGRDLTDEESAQIEAHEAELTEAQARRDRTDALRARAAERRKIVTPALHVDRTKDSDAAAVLDKAFNTYLRTGIENADLQQLRAAQSEGTPSEGGFLVHNGFRQKTVERMKAFGGLASVVDEITTDTGNELPWLVEADDTGNQAQGVVEGGTTTTGADLAYQKTSLVAHSYMAGGAGGNPLTISRELRQDAAFDIEGRLARKLGERCARIRAQLLCTGTGVSEPQGIVTGRTGTAMYGGASDALVYADFLNAVHAVDPAYREGGDCRWAFNDTFLRAVEGVLDLNGRPLLKDSTAGVDGKPSGGTLLGYPVVVDQGFANPSVNSGTVNFGVFGDLREGYVLRNVKAVELLVNPYAQMKNRQIEYSAWFRFDALIQNPFSYTALTGTP